MNKKYHFFWKGPLSQWSKSIFTVDGIQYVNAEQYMMHQKALLFGDTKIADMILNVSSPKTIQQLGREVKNFDKETWDKNCVDIVYKGNIAKFTQNLHLRKHLLEIDADEFVEASPIDYIWGIGLDEAKASVTPSNKWPGKNLLGKVITAVRNELRKDAPNE